MASERIMSRSSSSCSDVGSVQEELDNGKKIIEKLPMDNSLTKSISTTILNNNYNNKNKNNRESADNINDQNNKNKSKDVVGLKKKLKTSNNKKTGRRDPERFLGDGVNFKAKLIGSQDVPQPRGEKMAQEALQDLKAQKKLSGEHKRRIVINISLDGLRIREEKKKDVLYFHPVHKISFISQDAADNRAFGYIFGSPDNAHTFFAIKTEKMAHQVVMCMRDLFQIAFELKKREIEEWRKQQLSSDNKTSHGQSTSLGTDSNDGSTVSSNSRRETSSPTSMDSSNSSGQSHQFNSSAFDEGGNLLVDFSVAANRIQRMNEKLVPIDVDTMASGADNFFDDPWEYMRTLSTEDAFDDGNNSFGLELESSTKAMSPILTADDPFNTSFVHVPFVMTTSTPCIPVPVHSTVIPDDRPTSPLAEVDKYAALADISAQMVVNPTPAAAGDDTESSFHEIVTRTSVLQVSDTGNVSEVNNRSSIHQQDVANVFSDLDPLGKDRPYVDKKDFFYDVKNPPKKVLNDLIPKNAFPLPDFDAIAAEDKNVADDVEITSPPLSLPPPLPPPFVRRPRVASPIFNLADGGVEIPRPNSRSSMSTSSSSQSFTTAQEVYLPPPPPPPPRAQHLKNPCFGSSSTNKTGCRDSVYSSSGSSDGSSSPVGDGPASNSSSLINSTAPIPIPNRRDFGSPPANISSVSSSGISSTHNSGSFERSSNERAFTKWNNMSSSNPNTPTTILSPPPTSVSYKKSISNDQSLTWTADDNNNFNRQLRRTELNNKTNIFEKQEDPFNDDDFFSALRPNKNPFR